MSIEFPEAAIKAAAGFIQHWAELQDIKIEDDDAYHMAVGALQSAFEAMGMKAEEEPRED